MPGFGAPGGSTGISKAGVGGTPMWQKTSGAGGGIGSQFQTALDSILGGGGGGGTGYVTQQQGQGGGMGYTNQNNPYSKALQKKIGPTGGGGTGGGTGTGGSSIPNVPKLDNTAAPDANITQLYNQTQAALATPNAKTEDLWSKYQGQLDSSNLDRLQDVTGSKIRDRYEGVSKGLTENLARRGVLGSGVESEMRTDLAMNELGDLSQSDASLALADQARRDNLILSGQGLATYDDQRKQQLMALGLSEAQAMHALANQDKSLGLSEWQSLLDAQLSRENMALQTDIARQSAAQAQQNMIMNLLSQSLPLF